MVEFSSLSADQALLRLHAHGLPGLVLLESLGPLTAQSEMTLLSAAPVSVQGELPERPETTGLFPAWLGGLKYEAASAWGLPTHPVQGQAQHWGWYPSGLVCIAVQPQQQLVAQTIFTGLKARGRVWRYGVAFHG